MVKLDQWLSEYGQHLDVLAFAFLVIPVVLYRRDLVGFVVFCDFALMLFAYEWVESQSLWGALGLDYQYTLGIKDTLMALCLFLLTAHPIITLAYILAAFLCWVVWFSYQLLSHNAFLELFYAWSPLYALVMFIQILGLFTGDGNVGKIIRCKLIPLDWDRLLSPINSIMRTRIALPILKEKRAG